MPKNKKIDLVLTLKDFYVIHAALRLFASNIDFIRENILELSDEATQAEVDLQDLGEKIEHHIEQLTIVDGRIH